MKPLLLIITVRKQTVAVHACRHVRPTANKFLSETLSAAEKAKTQFIYLMTRKNITGTVPLMKEISLGEW